MLLSIVIPVYNAEPYLEKCLYSVVNQTYKNLEVILVDDCSTDSSYEIIKKFQKNDDRIRVFQNEKNSLVGVSRNLGIHEAKGDYIWFVDADDWLELDALETIVKNLNENKSIDVLLLGYSEHHSKNKITERIPDLKVNAENAFFYYLQLRKGLCPMALAYIYSRNMLLTNKIYFEEHVYFEDVAFSAKRTHFAKNIQAVPCSLYNYNRENERSITKSQSKNKIKHLMMAYEDIKSFMEKENLMGAYQNQLVSRFVVFGLARAFQMYLVLSKKEQQDGYFERDLFSYKKSPILTQKTLMSIMDITNSFDKDEVFIKKEYRRNLGFLWWVNNAFGPLKLINMAMRKLH